MAAPAPAREIRINEHPERRLQRLWWRMLHALCWVWFKSLYRHRASGEAHIPATGPVIYVTNHQSLFDPIIVGLAAWRRPFFALARSTLFTTFGFGWLIRSLNAIPVERGQADMTAMRRCLDVLKRGYALLIFPEGTRTPDGTVRPFATGTMLLIRRSGATVVPVAIEGAFAAWPRKCKLPHLLGRIKVHYGRPVSADELAQLPPEQALEMLRSRIESMRQKLAAGLDPDSHEPTIPPHVTG